MLEESRKSVCRDVRRAGIAPLDLGAAPAPFVVRRGIVPEICNRHLLRTAGVLMIDPHGLALCDLPPQGARWRQALNAPNAPAEVGTRIGVTQMHGGHGMPESLFLAWLLASVLMQGQEVNKEKACIANLPSPSSLHLPYDLCELEAAGVWVLPGLPGVRDADEAELLTFHRPVQSLGLLFGLLPPRPYATLLVELDQVVWPPANFRKVAPPVGALSGLCLGPCFGDS